MEMTLQDHLSIPFLQVYSTIGPDVRWQRYTEYPEIGCVSGANRAVATTSDLEERRIDYVVGGLGRGDPPVVPRPPLRSTAESLSPAFLRGVAERIAKVAEAGDG
jgi:hypothetical protein